MAHAVGLGFEIGVAVLVGGHLDGNARPHIYSRGPQPVDLERVVRHEPDALEWTSDTEREGQAQGHFENYPQPPERINDMWR